MNREERITQLSTYWKYCNRELFDGKLSNEVVIEIKEGALDLQHIILAASFISRKNNTTVFFPSSIIQSAERLEKRGKYFDANSELITELLLIMCVQYCADNKMPIYEDIETEEFTFEFEEIAEKCGLFIIPGAVNLEDTTILEDLSVTGYPTEGSSESDNDYDDHYWEPPYDDVEYYEEHRSDID